MKPRDARGPGDPRVVAVILTYRRTVSLRRAVEAVLGQTRPPDHVLVVDNDHRATETLSDLDRIEIVETGENLGPAGGYARGFTLARERGAEWIWTVDDDLVPDPDCLEQLLKERQDASVVVPLQRKPKGFVQGHPPSWNGPLFAAEIVDKIGVPRADLFFWAEDTEFFDRIKGAGFQIHKSETAQVFHEVPEDRTRGQARDWRLYYEVRNNLYVRLRLRQPSIKSGRRALVTTAGKLAAIVLFEPHKLRSMALWGRGVADFLTGRLGKRVAPEKWSK